MKSKSEKRMERLAKISYALHHPIKSAKALGIKLSDKFRKLTWIVKEKFATAYDEDFLDEDERMQEENEIIEKIENVEAEEVVEEEIKKKEPETKNKKSKVGSKEEAMRRAREESIKRAAREKNTAKMKQKETSKSNDMSEIVEVDNPDVENAVEVESKVLNAEKENKEEIKSTVIYNMTNEENKSSKLEKAYKKYEKLQELLNDKFNELRYLKEEYKTIEKFIYGDSFESLTVEQKRDLTLFAPKERLELLKEKLQEIKIVEKNIEYLTVKAEVYNRNYGMNIREKYRQDYINSVNDALFNKEVEDKRKEKMNDSLSLYNNFSDEELQTIYKYMDYQKTL